ncbi:putative leucine-rich repeat protein (LRRP) [Trypanosoma rangeli]|uniref:Putative leucine-rich repeat protein (LRRP) n=1 Tax=Trypanosoma rangeli TaxID=5698 RepID=A0A3R7N5K8_TRYRA|nr:putative leucine-rich repeat protein (LRRP) [Trypanosoma rangeli]RNF00585.1 putative leucine-rich repeat protein (LRRP) [Trypanosoma rangeli]|eukprot:RNF00585.1 putative leucine-rich repeat protein (LRRP) [Trypanosoma rangeli]
MTWNSTEDLFHLSDELDPACAFSRARGLALNLTERCPQWLAKSLVTELPQPKELHVLLDERRMPSFREMWWWIKIMFAGRAALRVICLLPRPVLALEPPWKPFGDDGVLTP